MCNRLQKRLFFSLLVAILATSAAAQLPERQNTFRGLVTAGLNVAQIDGDGPAGFHYFGAVAGGGVMVQFTDHILGSLELLYAMRGSREKGRLVDQSVEVFTVQMDYLEAPLSFILQDKNAVKAYAGLSPAYLMRFNLDYAEYDINDMPTGADPPLCLSVEPAKYDLSVFVGFSLPLMEVANIGLKYSYSLIGLREPCVGFTRARSQFHNVITLKASYIFQ